METFFFTYLFSVLLLTLAGRKNVLFYDICLLNFYLFNQYKIKINKYFVRISLFPFFPSGVPLHIGKNDGFHKGHKYHISSSFLISLVLSFLFREKYS